jgi:hypothetical protein
VNYATFAVCSFLTEGFQHAGATYYLHTFYGMPCRKVQGFVQILFNEQLLVPAHTNCTNVALKNDTK